MKVIRVTCCLFVLLLSLVAFAFSTTAPAAQAGPATIAKFTVSDLSVLAAFDTVSPDGCIESFVSVDAFQNTINQQTFSAADIMIGQNNNCTGTTLHLDVGSTTNPDFQISNSLDSASLNTTISGIDKSSGNTFSVSVNLTWTGISAIKAENTSTVFHTKGFTDILHLHANFRDATASGTVSNGTTNFTPLPSMFAQIGNFKAGEVIITQP